MIEKATTTHVMIEGGGVCHVLGGRIGLINAIERNYTNGYMGVEVTVVQQYKAKEPYVGSSIYLPLSLIKAVATEHVVDYDADREAPSFEEQGWDKGTSGLEVVL